MANFTESNTVEQMILTVACGGRGAVGPREMRELSAGRLAGGCARGKSVDYACVIIAVYCS